MNEMNQKWDSCLSKAAKYTTAGAFIGFTISLFVAKKRFPLTLYSSGIGTGYTYMDCEKAFKELYSKLDQTEQK